jgi:hypothetical protein
MMRVKRYLRRYPKERRPMVVGPNCAGIISPGKCLHLRGGLVAERAGARDHPDIALEVDVAGHDAEPTWRCSRRIPTPRPC